MTDRTEYIRSRKIPFAVGDAVIAVLMIAAALLALLSLGKAQGYRVEIAYGEERTVLPLGTDTEFSVDGHLTVVIKSGKCRVVSSDCRNKTCVNSGNISRVGESIVCAQNRVVITVIGDDGLAGTVGRG
ncbi:MAG: NusG domain II-containing protein [Clostridia bacterium]|nr:NusG domain II-containing protein [Clostridia bacterium]